MAHTLTMLDTSGIQHYIFNSNRLQENIGASELVYRATTLWAFGALAGLSHNIEFIGSHQWAYKNQQFEKDRLDAEVIYAGGGNTFILFRDHEKALETTERLTRHILKESPNLTVLAQHVEFNWGDDLQKKREELLRNLAAHKQSRQPSIPILGLGVSAVCQSTGLPAVRNDTGQIEIMGEKVSLRLEGQKDDPPRLLSRETVAKIGWRDNANKRLERELKREMGGHRFPFDVDKLGRMEGDESYVAVVHADGNRMGDKLNAAIKDIKDTRACIDALRAFSKKVNEAGLQALRHVIDLVVNAVDKKTIPYETETKNGREIKYLPIRPLVFGGDDLTLLSNGNIGLSVAAEYLEAFERAFKEAPIIRGLEDVHARAGIAIIKMHYPFARAYQLSEELAASAKHFIKTETNSDCSALDWHYATSGLSGDLDVIREREYEVKEGKLLLRPIRIDQGDQKESGRYWRNGLEEVLLKFKHDSYWSKRKNKVIGLRDVLRKNGDAVETYRRNFDIQLLPELASPVACESGWQDHRCVYFDAVELFDHYLPLEEKKVQS